MKALFISALSILPFLAFAQEGKGARSCRIIFPLAAQDAPKTVFMLDGVECRAIDLPRLSLSEPIQLPAGDLTLAFSDKQLETGDPAPNDAPSVRIGRETGDVYLVVSTSKDKDGNPSLDIRAVAAGADRFTNGQMIWANLSDTTVTGKVGIQSLHIEPGKEVIVDQPAPGRSNYLVALNFTDPKTNRQRPLMENQWRHDPQSRVLALVIRNGDRKTPRILTFSDHPSSGAP